MSTSGRWKVWAVVAIVVLVLVVFVAWFNTSWHYEVLGPVEKVGPSKIGIMYFLFDYSDQEPSLVGFVGKDNITADQWSYQAIQRPNGWPNPVNIQMTQGETGVCTSHSQLVYRVYPFGVRFRAGVKRDYVLSVDLGRVGNDTSFIEPAYGDDQVGVSSAGDYLDPSFNK